MATTESSASEASAGVTSAQGPRAALEIDRLFEALVKFQGSDLHLKVGQPPFLRVKGALQPLKTPR
jgi:twitching motility protein PilT